MKLRALTRHQVAMMLQEILDDYERTFAAAAAPKVSTRDVTGDRDTDVKSSCATKSLEISTLYGMYFSVRRDRGEEIRMSILRKVR